MADHPPSAILTKAINNFADHHPGSNCVDCLTLVYQAGVLDGADGDLLRALLADEVRALPFLARTMANCCDECAVDPDGAAMRDARSLLTALRGVAEL